MTMKTLPKAKRDNVVVQNLPKELLVYDLTTNKAFCLNEISAKVFEFCDGKTTFTELKSKYQLTKDVVYLALDELKRNNLLQDSVYISPFAGLSRREAITKVALASMTALPVISSLVAPSSAQAQSLLQVVCTTPNGATCNAQTDCAAVQYCNTEATAACTCTGNCCVECPRGINNGGSVCNNACTDLSTDIFNCGGCGNVCNIPNPICVFGVCVSITN